MKNLKHIIFIIILLAINGPGCKEVYQPPAIQKNPNLLVVDGIIISGNDSSVITLSRTRNLTEYSNSIKELDAQVSVVGESGVEYGFQTENNGRYVISNLQLDNSQKYQLKIITSDGNEFRSDLANVRTSPPIDSVYWSQDSSLNVRIFLDTHDPTNSTTYYRWDYTETWEYQSAYQSTLEYVNGTIIPRPVSNQIFRCYISEPSSSINVANTTRLSTDIVSKYNVATVPVGSEKISKLYSNQVRQYAITVDAFNFWQNLKRNTEQLGSLFDLQPFTELGNIHCMNNPAIKCIGFISFSTVQEKRVFIYAGEVAYWNYYPYYGACAMDTVPPAELPKFFQPPGGPYFNSLIGTDNGAVIFSSNLCVDCTDHGGSPIQPPFWP
jgi:hypothetical protein